MQRIKSFIKRRSKLQIAGAVMFLFVGFLLFRGGEDKTVLSTIERGRVEQEVVATGKVRSVEEVDLGFEKSGRVVSVGAMVGEKVGEGETLVVIDQAEISASLKKAQAELNDALISLEKTRRTAGATYETSYNKAVVALSNAYNKTRDAVYNTADKFFYNAKSYSPILDINYFSGNFKYEFRVDNTLASELSVLRAGLNDTFTSWSLLISKAQTENLDLSKTFESSEQNIILVKNFLSKLALALGSLTDYDQTYDTIISGYKTSVDTVRTAVNTAETDLLSAKAEYIDSPRISGTVLGGEYDSVLQEESRVEVARAEVDSLRAQLAKTVIYSPIDGVVTKQEAKVGEIITAGTEVVSVISDKNLEIEADVSEVNIGKVSPGDPVRIELDAFPGRTFVGKVLYVEPGEKIVDGVVNYEIRVGFEEALPENIKTGLTSSLYITTEVKEDVLLVPLFAVDRRENKRFVMVKTAKGDEEREVVLGLIGKDGLAEVISGLSSGDIVVSEGKN